MKKILTVIGARPQFIKASVVSRAISASMGLRESIVHTGQHFDANMSDIFFEQLGIPRPDYQLNINGGSHGNMTGRMLIDVEKILLEEKPDNVLVYGDTNSTLAGALAAAKLCIPVAHVEAGLRSYNMRMPEEINRILTDQVSDILFCPTETAINNLRKEGFFDKPISILNVGDVMQDAALFFSEKSQKYTDALKTSYGEGFVLATIHRAENTDDPDRLKAIISTLNEVHKEFAHVVMPIHPRTAYTIKRLGLKVEVTVIEPVGYLEMLALLRQCSLVLTDSGGVQKEAFFFQKSCVVMRDQTEWTELVDLGANFLVGADHSKILAAVQANIGRVVEDHNQLYGGGNAAKKIVEQLL